MLQRFALSLTAHQSSYQETAWLAIAFLGEVYVLVRRLAVS
jgi:hypothetical protein